MKLVLPGGSGFLGQVLAREFLTRGHDVVVLARHPRVRYGRFVPWDGRSVGDWAAELDGADAVVNLAGRSVNCRYTKTNLTQMFASRVDSTRAVGLAIHAAQRPPPVWLQMSTATIYAHRFDAPNDEINGVLGGNELGAPTYWRMSVEIARAWERTFWESDTLATRKVALRSAMVMGNQPGSVFDVLMRLSRLRLGGPIAGGQQYVSWIHEADFFRALEFLIDRADIEGVVNVVAPEALPQRDFMAVLRRACGLNFGLPATAWMLALAAVVQRTDAELLLKSRRVAPRRLVEAGFTFQYPTWALAARDLVERSIHRASA
ncbi:MAG: DUF1731 domain-containing protein [Chloroflexi bacterium]|nr:DUF1731 domain-containing protein [Chloroflexota bacterium]